MHRCLKLQKENHQLMKASNWNIEHRETLGKQSHNMHVHITSKEVILEKVITVNNVFLSKVTKQKDFLQNMTAWWKYLKFGKVTVEAFNTSSVLVEWCLHQQICCWMDFWCVWTCVYQHTAFVQSFGRKLIKEWMRKLISAPQWTNNVQD